MFFQRHNTMEKFVRRMNSIRGLEVRPYATPGFALGRLGSLVSSALGPTATEVKLMFYAPSTSELAAQAVKTGSAGTMTVASSEPATFEIQAPASAPTTTEVATLAPTATANTVNYASDPRQTVQQTKLTYEAPPQIAEETPDMSKAMNQDEAFVDEPQKYATGEDYWPTEEAIPPTDPRHPINSGGGIRPVGVAQKEGIKQTVSMATASKGLPLIGELTLPKVVGLGVGAWLLWKVLQ